MYDVGLGLQNPELKILFQSDIQFEILIETIAKIVVFTIDNRDLITQC